MTNLGHFQRLFEDFDLVHERQMFVIGSQALHDLVLNIEQDFLLLSVILDELVQSVRVGHPTDQARVCRQRNDSKPLDGQIAPERLGVAQKKRVDQTEELHDPLVLSQVLVALQQERVRPSVGPTNAKLARTLLRYYYLYRENEVFPLCLESFF